ncbi:pentatricopeptide repeat-containing protein At1g18900-like [Magnolia sinica]|uniref:pentatricopeptide repeat-containing protein At1g18900-like n=1 Tax=Magnolia sinica TaxID=86752 RepID=UPI002657B73F|nr:pentatricopeptide repeat-containing protein At1g18900-like [Magnolia sinica]XP_058097198.1 pentatricopeptide repeat-containing protein At1g18900-like [Magnolia sinica]XP_058097199.1 pentatricopeptide repeat-containing protein At1g18900-like [Magnolia sinica]XP_058097200.1 pentatricopeptide repeat-containing protein At1g18900-like [Magnolia sinica]XP_058097201.1 pentatricopeptide repeat-containing protein At1g18900-like [Magnolia sinica]
MLRTKQLGTLSQCARSFFLSGSRSGAADGASCTCSEDETCVSKRQSTSADILFTQKAPTLASKTTPGAGIPLSTDARGPFSYYKTESCGYPASTTHVPSAPSSSLRSDGSSTDNNVHAAQKDLGHSSLLVTDHLIKAGIAMVGVLSDLVNYRIPTLDGSGLLVPQNCMVDSTRPLSNISSSNGKSKKAADFSEVQSNLSADTATGSRSRAQNHDPKGKAGKPGPVKALQHVPSEMMGTSAGTRSSASNKQNRRRPVPRRAKSRSSGVLPNVKSGGRKPEEVAAAMSETIGSVDKVQQPMRSARMSAGPAMRSGHPVDKVQQPTRSIRMHAGAAPFVSPSVNTGRIVDHVYHILRHLKWGPAAEEALGNLSCKLDAYQANQILKLLQDHSVAFGFFYWLKCQDGFKHDEHSYTTMVGILGRARLFGSIRRLLDEMIRDGCQPNVVTYNRLIHSYGRANYMDEAVNVFYQMQEVGCRPDRVTYCTLIDIHAKAGYLEVAMDIYRRMQEAGLSPDTFTYSVIINCLGKAGHLSAAYKLFCEMVAQGCVPNLVTYNIMIALQAKARNYPCALRLYRDMQTAGFQPDKVTYSIVMEVLGHCGYLDEAEAVFAEMKREDWVPDEHVYGLLVDLWGKAGDVDKARGWYQSMLDAGLRPNVPTCNSLLSAFLRANRFSDAHDVLQSMLSLGLHPSLQTYTLLLSCCTDTRSPGDMGLCCELMAITGHPAHVFLLTMPAAEPDGQNVRDHAAQFLDLMHTEDRESKRGLVDAVIDFLHKSGLKEEAGSVWEVAALRNLYPDAVREKRSSYWLINLHVMSDGTAVTALSRTLAWFRRQMLASGIGPNRIDIVTGWGRRSRVTGSSMVRQSVQELLHLFGFPFFTENGNSGCFVGCGDSLSRWLLQSYVERMHLL